MHVSREDGSWLNLKSRTFQWRTLQEKEEQRMLAGRYVRDLAADMKCRTRLYFQHDTILLAEPEDVIGQKLVRLWFFFLCQQTHLIVICCHEYFVVVSRVDFEGYFWELDIL